MDIITREEVDTRRVTTFHEAEVRAFPAIGSNHSPFLLRLQPESKAGKEILIKSVVQAIPTYAMSIFKLPMSIFNHAMLGKQAWRLSNSPSALWSRVLKGIYFPNGDLWKASKGQRPSWGWQSRKRTHGSGALEHLEVPEQLDFQSKTSATNGSARWKLPDQAELKINVDTS